MPKIKIKPHSEICPKGAIIEAEKGSSLCEAMLDNKINIEHACELSCACTTCHVIVTNGFEKLNEASEEEEDLLDLAFDVRPTSRLGCQLTLSRDLNGLVVSLPSQHFNVTGS